MNAVNWKPGWASQSWRMSALQRLPAGEKEGVAVQVVGLVDDTIGQVQLLAVFRRPATGAVGVTGGDRIAGDVAAVLPSVPFLLLKAEQVGVQTQSCRRWS